MFRFKYGTVEITVRRATVRDDLHAQIINARLQEDVPVGEMGLWKSFGDLCSVTRKAKGLEFDPTILYKADKETIKAAYEKFLDLDKVIKDRWVDTVSHANKVTDIDLGPEPLPDDADPNA